MISEDARRRVVIEAVSPEVDGGRFPIKRIAGDEVVVEADVFADGHDEIACRLLYRREDAPEWSSAAMELVVNDRWRASFPVPEVGRYQYRIEGWPAPFQTWRRDLKARVEAGQDVRVELKVGADFCREAASRASGEDAQRLLERAAALEREWDVSLRVAVALDEVTNDLMLRNPDRGRSTVYDRGLTVVVDRERARFGAWYEMFPRSASPDATRAGTFDDVIARLPYVASMGCDVLYMPPVHPIGHTQRRGKNNTASTSSTDPGSPWAIGSEEGGHKAVDPHLGTIEDFRRLVGRARDRGIEVALDLALQCTPDHPYVREHPEWFKRLPGGEIRHAENPPKKYFDIYPLDFDSEDWWDLWQEVKSIVDFWIEQGVRIFRVDNPHTKPFAFWEWLISGVKAEHPDIVFLSEAFTRPKVMYRLAKLGFTQSYTYFAWRNAKWELTQYFTELTEPPVSDFFRPNLWPNTPDILTEYLQSGGRPAFVSRLILAATLGASYGIYGPAFELCESLPREQGSEEYLDSEKYEVRHWDIDREESLSPLIARVNQVRRDNPALQRNDTLRFHHVENGEIIAYSKSSEDGSNLVLTVVNLDPHHTQSGWLELPLADLGIDAQEPFQVHDQLDGSRYIWYGSRNYVELNPHVLPAHVFVVRRHMRSEQDFEYFR